MFYIDFNSFTIMQKNHLLSALDSINQCSIYFNIVFDQDLKQPNLLYVSLPTWYWRLSLKCVYFLDDKNNKVEKID